MIGMIGVEDKHMSDAYRPLSFESFIGQERPKKVLEILCKAAKRKGTCVPHVLLSGPPGLGKTTLARIVANEMGSRLIEVVASNLQATEQMAKHLTKLQPKDVLFIDEIHGLPRGVEEVLYAALEDGRIPIIQNCFDDLMKTLGIGGGRSQPTTAMVELPPFTCIGATTLSGLVSDPLRSRFVQALQLEPYSDEDLQKIVQNAAVSMKFDIAPSVALEIAVRSRATARTAIGNLRWFNEYCEGTESKPDIAAIGEAFALKDVDNNGLTKLDRAYLAILAEATVPLGISTLASAVGENEDNLLQAIEPFLIRKGYVRKTGRGRVATSKAIELITGRAA
jgi:Holliday junction DNA helicase RuvB